MSFESRDVVLGEDIAMGEPSGSSGDADGWEDLDGFTALPPGEEGMFMSNAGGEEQIVQEMIEYSIPQK